MSNPFRGFLFFYFITWTVKRFTNWVGLNVTSHDKADRKKCFFTSLFLRFLTRFEHVSISQRIRIHFFTFSNRGWLLSINKFVNYQKTKSNYWTCFVLSKALWFLYVSTHGWMRIYKILLRSPSPKSLLSFSLFHNAFFCGVNINTVKWMWEGNIFTIIVNLWETAQKGKKKYQNLYTIVQYIILFLTSTCNFCEKKGTFILWWIFGIGTRGHCTSFSQF